MSQNHAKKVLIIGTGIAGLSAALKFVKGPEHSDVQVTIIAKTDSTEGSTRYAQGGIASVWSKQDTFEEHIQDTLVAGAGLCHSDIVKICVEEGPDRVRELIEMGVAFTRRAEETESESKNESDIQSGQDYDLHREGGHGKRRILHADDLTGLAIEKALLEQVAKTPQIEILEHHIAIDLITEGKVLGQWSQPGRCLGAYVLNCKTGKILTLAAGVTVLASGGAGKVYLYTSNPDTATGDGIAMAHRAGAQVANLEFMQFHPTCLFHPEARTFLISEALRGEGAILRNTSGEDFMTNHHPMGSLAPRDIVARAIDMEMKRSGAKNVLLDCSMIPEADLRKKFPNIYETCMKFGIDITEQPIPIVPAAHYTCGGVWVDAHGQSSIAGLYAIGEVACTGLHGANRLASNSLLEAVVFAHRAYQKGLSDLEHHPSDYQNYQTPYPGHLPEWDSGQAVALEEQIDIAATWLEIRSLMWNYVGIVRSNRRLERAERRLKLLKEEINTYYWNYLLTRDLIELRNILTVAELIVKSAKMRMESRGLHYTVDYPTTSEEYLKDTMIL